jgi:predicted dehydrogenase
VVEAASAADRLLAVDLGYRYTRAAQAVKGCDLTDIHAVEAAFHNASAPDRPWFYRRDISGGGCLLDLGIHLVDLVLWMLDWRRSWTCERDFITAPTSSRTTPQPSST